LSAPEVGIVEGDVIESINGKATLSVPDIGMLLRRQAGRQVLVRVLPSGGGEGRDAIVRPISRSAAADLRYHEWEYTRRLLVEEAGKGEIGYVHLRAMGGGNFTEWARGFYPVFTRKGLIVDVRHNRGGNIDSWILNRLLRKIWFYWSQHEGRGPIWNMQYAFGGHVVVLCDERTASDGEAFTEGIRRLGIGTIIGTRTWGGEIWLSSNNFLVDRGIATAAEYGVFSPEGEWLIEGHGVEPDIVVDNLPNETFNGRDAQLEAALEFLERKIREEPVEIPPLPQHPDLSFP
jgi:tricorn protease